MKKLVSILSSLSISTCLVNCANIVHAFDADTVESIVVEKSECNSDWETILVDDINNVVKSCRNKRRKALERIKAKLTNDDRKNFGNNNTLLDNIFRTTCTCLTKVFQILKVIYLLII